MDFPSFTTLFQTARAKALQSTPLLSQDAVNREGTDANILLASACAAAEQVVGQLVTVAAGLYLDSATGDALDRLLFDRYGLTRKVAAQALGSVVFSLPTGAPYAFTIPAGTQLATPDGVQYETIESELFPQGASDKYVSVRSLLAGVSQQAKIGTITNIVTSVAGAPEGLSVSNPIATAGASDRESDSDFRARGQAFFTTVRRGTMASIVQGALTVPGVVRASAFEQVAENGGPAGFVILVIADQYTDALAELATVPPLYQQQSKVLAQQVFNALTDYRPAGIFVQVQLAQVIVQTVQLALSFQAGVDIDSVATAARAACVNAINNLNPGQTLTPAMLQARIEGVAGLYITGREVQSPAGPVVPNPLQVLRASLSSVLAISSNPATPIGSYTNPDGR